MNKSEGLAKIAELMTPKENETAPPFSRKEIIQILQDDFAVPPANAYRWFKLYLENDQWQQSNQSKTSPALADKDLVLSTLRDQLHLGIAEDYPKKIEMFSKLLISTHKQARLF